MTSDVQSARELTGRLVARAAATKGGPAGPAGAVHAACERIYRELSRRLGVTGSDALFARALAQAKSEHLALEEVEIRRNSEPTFEGVTAAVQTHGAPAVVAGLETVLERLIELLGRLVGDDMVVRLVEPSPARRDER